jgi:hypothetical protein
MGRCSDKGIENFKRYIALSVLAYNLHNLHNQYKLGERASCSSKIDPKTSFLGANAKSRHKS